jgi:hypothetical protein
MPIVLIVEKSGEIKELNLKNYDESELFKKAGFKSAEGFSCATQWDIEIPDVEKSYRVCLYGKTKGRANQENKYDFPPPVDKILFFGSCVLVNTKDDGKTAENLSAKEWEKIYEALFGGFEDIGSEDSDASEESEVSASLLTKDGYMKDGFVVDSNSSSEDEHVTVRKKKKDKKETKAKASETASSTQTTQTTQTTATKKKKKPTVFEKIEDSNEIEESPVGDGVQCTDELEEEEYL